MFQFRRFPTYAYLIQRTLTEYCSAGFPHSEISGSTVICTSPELIAACHVLRRLLMPRHSPCALISLTFSSPRQSPFAGLWLGKGLSFKHSVLFESSNYAGVRVLTKLLLYPFLQKVPQLRLFPSVACSSYFWFLCSVFKVRLRL